VVELECQGPGKLTISVKDDLKRTWARDTRLERHGRKLPPITPQLTGNTRRRQARQPPAFWQVGHGRRRGAGAHGALVWRRGRGARASGVTRRGPWPTRS
jgi:hypothetical protein